MARIPTGKTKTTHDPAPEVIVVPTIQKRAEQAWHRIILAVSALTSTDDFFGDENVRAAVVAGLKEAVADLYWLKELPNDLAHKLAPTEEDREAIDSGRARPAGPIVQS